MLARAVVTLALLLVTTHPASALETEDAEPPFTPHAAPSGPTPLDIAQQRVQRYLQTVPNLPKDIVVVPATGVIPWPEAPPHKDVRAEIWTVMERNRESAYPIMYFAVRPETGEVYALFQRSLQPKPKTP